MATDALLVGIVLLIAGAICVMPRGDGRPARLEWMWLIWMGWVALLFAAVLAWSLVGVVVIVLLMMATHYPRSAHLRRASAKPSSRSAYLQAESFLEPIARQGQIAWLESLMAQPSTNDDGRTS